MELNKIYITFSFCEKPLKINILKSIQHFLFGKLITIHLLDKEDKT